MVSNLVREREATHTGLDAKDVVVDREHVEVGRVVRTGGGSDRHLGVVNAAEVAGAGGLVLLGLEREGVGVDTRVWRARVVLVGLDLVEVLTRLLLEAVLAVEDKLRLSDSADRLLSELGGATTSAFLKKGRTDRTWRDEDIGCLNRRGIRLKDNFGIGRLGGEVPKTLLIIVLGEAPHELLHWVVVGEANLLCSTGGGDRVNTSVLNLLDEILVTLLREATALLGVEVEVISPDLEGVAVSVSAELTGEVEIDANLVVLEGDEGERETWVAVEEKNQREENSRINRGGHLTPVKLLRLVEVELGVETPPLLVVLVDTLTTDGKLGRRDRTLSDPARIRGGTRGAGRDARLRLELDVHVTDEITVARNGDGHATGVRGSTVDGLLDVLHREVGVALVFRLEEGHLRVTGKVNVLGAVSYELHETTGHCESCCTIYRENNFGEMRNFHTQKFSVKIKCLPPLKKKSKLRKEKSYPNLNLIPMLRSLVT